MADDILRWAGLIAPAIAFIGIWVKFGELKQTVAELGHQMTLTVGKHELLRDEVARHKVEVARDYATNAEVKQAVETLGDRLDRAIERLGDRLDQRRGS